MGWIVIVPKFTNIAKFVWKFGIWNLVWTEPNPAHTQMDSAPEARCPPENFLCFYWPKFFSLCLHWLVFQVDSGPECNVLLSILTRCAKE